MMIIMFLFFAFVLHLAFQPDRVIVKQTEPKKRIDFICITDSANLRDFLGEIAPVVVQLEPLQWA